MSNQALNILRIEDLFIDDAFSNFLDYCKDCNIVYVSEIEPVDYIAFRKQNNIDADFINQIKNKVILAKQGLLNEETFHITENQKTIETRIDIINIKEPTLSFDEDKAVEKDLFKLCQEPNYDNVVTSNQEEYSCIPIEHLQLSVRSSNCLKRSNIFTVADLLKLSDDDLMKIQYLGITSFNDIKYKLAKIVKPENITLRSKYAFIKNTNISIKSLGLSVRSYHFLKTSNIVTLADLLRLSEKELLKIRNLGQTSFKEIKTKLDEIIKINDPVDLNNYSTKEKSNVQITKVSLNENLRIALERIVITNEKIENLGIFTQSEVNFLEKVRVAVEVIDSEACMGAYLHPERITSITNMLSQFSYDCQKAKNKIEELSLAFSCIDIQRKQCKIKPFIIAYTIDERLIKILNDYLGKCEFIFELKTFFNSIVLNEIAFLAVRDFIKWLIININEVILNVFSKIYKNDRSKELIECRVNGGTLETAGQLIGVTRERIRQIEKKVQIRFDYINSRIKILLLISAIRNGDCIITEDEISETISQNVIELIYLLKNSGSKYYIYNKELKLFILDNEINQSFINEFINQLPSYFLKENLQELILKANEENIPEELFLSLLNKEYKLTGNYYHKTKLSLTEVYDCVLKEYYPHGAKLFDKNEMIRFKNNIYNTFGNIKLPENNRAIDARVADIGILCDRGTYIHSYYLNISQDIINKIDSYIENSNRNAISFLELFEIFKDELLLNSNVSNRFFLQGVLKFYIKNKYNFTKESVSKDKDIRIDEELNEFVKLKGEVTKAEIKNFFKGITEAMLLQAITRCKEIIILDNALYINANRLNILEKDYKIKSFVENNISNMPISSRKLFSFMYNEYSDFIFRNDINSHTKLFGVLKYMFEDCFKFSRPFIAQIGTDDLNNIGMLKKHLTDYSVIEVSQLIDICEENHLQFNGWSYMIKQLDNEFIRSDSNELIRIDELEIDDEKLKIIRQNLITDISIKGYLSARKIESYIFYPDIGVKWTGFLLKSLSQKYFDEIVIIDAPSTDLFFLNSIFVSFELEIDDYEEFLRWVVKTEHINSPFKDLIEIKEWLIDEGLINNEIPKFMTEKQYLYIDEYNKVIVQ